ncbi:MAG: hypothetical protein H7Z17_16955 [Fuerstia sp.]|nr:hypothetical protein [Fuerstiella sp.]
MIVTCPNCRKTLKAPDGAAGKKIRCPGCLEIIAVPAEGGAGGGSSSITKPATKPKPPSASPAPESTASPRRSPSSSSAAESKPAAKSGGRSASASAGSTGGPQSGTPARPKSKPTSTTSGTGASSRPPKRPKREDPAEYDDDYGSGYEASEVDPWSSGPSWEEPNPYAAPTYGTSTSRSKKSTGSGSLKLAGIGLLVQAWSYIGIIVGFFSLIAIGVIVAATRSGGGGGVGPAEVGMVFAGLGVIVMIPLGLAILVGYVLCAFVPANTGARTPMIIALVLSVLMFLFSILEAVGTAFNSPGTVLVISGLRLVMWIAQIVSFCLFMKAAATYVRRDDLAQSANIVMYGLTIGPFLAVVGAFLAGILGAAVAPAAGIVMFIGVAVISLGILVVWVMQLFLMFRLGTAMKNY